MPRVKTEIRYRGLPLSKGAGLARICLFNDRRHSNLPVFKVQGEGLARERERLRTAVALAVERLDQLRTDVAARIGPAEAEIFVAQKMILGDERILREIAATIESRECNAESAVAAVLDVYENRLQAVDNAYIKERATDIGEVRRRVLDMLANMNPSLQCADEAHCQRGRNRIVVAEELTPSLTVELDTARTIGFVTERGGVNSHAAILARAFGIPAVSGIEGIHALLSCGTEVLVNGDTGDVIVWPTDSTVAAMRADRALRLRKIEPVLPVPGFAVLASISRAGDVSEANAMLAEGIGLYRTEFEFLAANRALNEDEQTALYRRVVAAMPGKAVYVRALDIGGDKAVPFLNIHKEDNPYLGFRGARFLLGNRELFASQARALARASELGPLHIMYPMVTGTEQFLELKRLFEEVTRDIVPGCLRHGVMFEVPSACLEAQELFAVADFGSVGSNDLIQYLFAVDRNNERVAYDYRADRPVFWRLLEQVSAAARAAGKPLSVCGEVASDPTWVPRLAEVGITAVSVSPRLIPGVRLAAGARPDAGT